MYPQSDGMVERFNQTIENQVSNFVQDHQRDWDQHIPLLLRMSYRTAENETTRFTPAMLMFGRELRIPLDLLVGRPPEETEGKSYPEYVEKLRESLETIHEFTRDRQQSASQGMKTRYEQNSFSRGDLVLLHNT